MRGGLQAARAALAGERAWLVGGAVRDGLLGREALDVDLVLEGDTALAARAVARAAGGAACFALSEEFGSWRVVARDHSWQVDLEPLRAETLQEDLRLRDFTVNAIAQPLQGGDLIDPLGGMRDLEEGVLRMAGPGAFADDPLRVLRLVRTSVEMGLAAEEATARAARGQAGGLADVSGERIFAELRRILSSSAPSAGLQLASAVGACAVVLPELEALRGVAQNRYHHLDVLGHTLEVLDRTADLTAGPGGGPPPDLQGVPGARVIAPEAAGVHRLLTEPLADGLTRGQALRWGALLHDAAKPLTAERAPGGHVTFYSHDVRGAELAREVLGRMRASERLRAHVAALVRCHLRLGFLVHEPQPLARRTVYAYMRACEPVPADVTLLSLADRLATRGDRAEESIAAHVAVAERMLPDALRWHEDGPPAALLRGDELARELGITPGPQLGGLLEELSAARYAGEVSTREQALARARELLASV